MGSHRMDQNSNIVWYSAKLAQSSVRLSQNITFITEVPRLVANDVFRRDSRIYLFYVAHVFVRNSSLELLILRYVLLQRLWLTYQIKTIYEFSIFNSGTNSSSNSISNPYLARSIHYIEQFFPLDAFHLHECAPLTYGNRFLCFVYRKTVPVVAVTTCTLYNDGTFTRINYERRI